MTFSVYGFHWCFFTMVDNNIWKWLVRFKYYQLWLIVFVNDNVILQPSSNWGSSMYVNFFLIIACTLKYNVQGWLFATTPLFKCSVVALCYQSYLLVSFIFNCYKLNYAHALVSFMNNASYTSNCNHFLTWMI